MREIFFRAVCLFAIGSFANALSAQCCEYNLLMQDSYGDGWNGGTLEVMVNNVSIGVFSAVDFGSSASISICTGDSFELIYSGGDYENENVYQLVDASWNLVFSDGPEPQTGSVFTSVADCDTPVLPGVSPCVAIPLVAGECITADNTIFPGSGLNPFCANYVGGDVWFAIEVPSSGNLSVQTDGGTINDTGIAAWLGENCINLNLIGCDDDGGNGYYSYLLLNDLTPGETLYLQVFGYGTSAGSFELCTVDLGTVVFESSELPIVMINTLGQTIVPETKIDCLMDIKYNGQGTTTNITDPSNVYSGNIGIEIRGATSSGYPQRPYGIETRNEDGTNNNVSLLGMPAENDWVLLSNYNDRSLMKNQLAYDLFREMSNYSVRTQLCEVLVDSAYRGIYLFAEKIKRDANRVDIAALNPIDVAGDQVTGGYILQQNYWDENNSFQSNFSPIDHPDFDIHFVYEYPKPEDILQEQKDYIASFIDSLETALYSPDFSDIESGYRAHMDVKSFIDYFIVNELSRNADGFKKSVFFNKDKYSNGGKLKAGPVWDFDWAWKNLDTGCPIYNTTTGEGWAHQNNDCFTDNYSTGWYVRLQQDTTFSNELRCVYDGYRQTILSNDYLFNYIDSIGELVQNAQTRHFQKWPVLGISGPAPDLGPVATTYYGELDSLKNWIATRLEWLDANIPGNCIAPGVAEASVLSNIECYPNPTDQQLNVVYTLDNPELVVVTLLNEIGKEVAAVNKGIQGQGQHVFSIDTSRYSPGFYVLRMQIGEQTVSKRIVVLR